jgi:hypothetical protein
MFGSYIMFHYVRGVPFEFNGGAYDNLNMWEQIDDGDQYTPAKKFLLSVPIMLFLLSTVAGTFASGAMLEPGDPLDDTRQIHLVAGTLLEKAAAVLGR